MYFDEFTAASMGQPGAHDHRGRPRRLFAGFSGDFNPLHTDEEFAKTTQFGDGSSTVPGVFAIATGLESRLGLRRAPRIAFLGMTWNLKGAVRIGDTIHVHQTVAEQPRHQQGRPRHRDVRR